MERPLERLLKEREAKAKELYDTATPTVHEHGGLGKLTMRRYVIDIYEENTEFGACMYMLANIARWFSVRPLEEDSPDA